MKDIENFVTSLAGAIAVSETVMRAMEAGELSYKLAKAIAEMPEAGARKMAEKMLAAKNTHNLTPDNILARARDIAEAPSGTAATTDGQLVVASFFGPDDKSTWLVVPIPEKYREAVLETLRDIEATQAKPRKTESLYEALFGPEAVVQANARGEEKGYPVCKDCGIRHRPKDADEDSEGRTVH